MALEEEIHSGWPHLEAQKARVPTPARKRARFGRPEGNADSEQEECYYKLREPEQEHGRWEYHMVATRMLGGKDTFILLFCTASQPTSLNETTVCIL